MPPFVPRKREHSPDPSPRTDRKRQAKAAKSSLFEDADAPSRNRKSVVEAQKFLDSLDGDDDDDSSDNEVDSDEFEDVPTPKKQKIAPRADEQGDGTEDVDKHENEDEDEGMEWEDAIKDNAASGAPTEPEIGDISVSINQDGSYVEPLISFATGKKGPSKKERQVRVLAHCMHVQLLMWHNTVRNSWLNNTKLQKILVDALPEGVKREIGHWKEAMGTLSIEELEDKKKRSAAKNNTQRRGKGKQQKNGRDWNYDAQHSEQGVPNLSHGDPLWRLLKVLTSYWRKRFTITTPAFRKRGYMPLRRLREEIKGWEKDRNNEEDYGERVENVQALCGRARKCEGSRDVGAQLFVALLRGIGLETRLVASLQPIGFGWSKSEEADPKKSKRSAKITDTAADIAADKDTGKGNGTPAKKAVAEKVNPKLKEETRKSARGVKANPINLDDSDSSLSEPPTDFEHEPHPDDADEDDDISVVDVTPETPRTRATIKKYDRDLAFPTYWAEVRSPASHKFIPVDPIVLSTVASNNELLCTFEPRGKKADRSKQVICYVIAVSADGTAKDVTVRYLKRHQLPGKTKGMRMAVEKVPIYNRKGKVKKYEEYDWFRTVMSLYDRPELKRTSADDLEEQTDLKPYKPAKDEKEVEKESLQWYKQSANYVLEQHLRREEAIVPGAEPVKMFTAGKGDKAREHPVYLREDVVVCKTVESWHKEGRMIKTGEQPMKHVPMRAVTLVRKREMEDAQRETGEKLKQGLYSRDQTDWIIPPPIEDGVIPKNAFGNMDVYVDTMVPKGAVHLPLKGTAKLCRKLEIDYAEACTGFEFGKQRAVPVLTGVVVAEENAQMVRDAWRAEQEEIKRKEDTKRTATALHWWRKMLMGMRIVERMRAEYEQAGSAEDEINPFISKAHQGSKDGTQNAGPGGFFVDDYGDDEAVQDDYHLGGGFRTEIADDHQDHYAGDGGFLVEDDADDHFRSKKPVEAGQASTIPVSLKSMHQYPHMATDADEETTYDSEPAQDALPQAKAPYRKTAKTPRKPQGKTGGKGKVIPLQENASADQSGSSLSDISSSDFSDDESKIDSPMSEASAERVSPQVIVRARRNAAHLAPSSPGTRSARKVTPIRSQYFVSTHSEDEDVDDEDEEFSEQEVTKPTRTTARTRNRCS